MTGGRQKIIVWGPVLLCAVAAAALVLLLAYLFVGGVLLGLNLSSLDEDGPQWPATAGFLLASALAIGTPLAALWAWLWTRGLNRRGRTAC